MKTKISTIVVIVVAIPLLYLAGRFGFTIVSIEEANQAIEDEAFDPVTYVDEIWESRILPTFSENSVELSEVFIKMEPDADGTVPKEHLTEVAEEYGLITLGEAHVYMVNGSGKIIDVNTESSLGTAEVALDGYDGPIKALLYIGSRIPSDESSVRDAVGFITFGDFKEQTEYGKVGSQINKHILSTVLDVVNPDALTGKTISFEGAFTIRTFNLLKIDVSEILIVPVKIELGGN